MHVDGYPANAPPPDPSDPLTRVATLSTEPKDPAAPPKRPLYKRLWFIVSSIIGACVGIALLFVLLFPVIKAIIQDVVNKTTITITAATMTVPTNTSFHLSIQGTVLHTSTISSVISFPTPTNVSWIDGSTKVPLGYLQLSTLYASDNHATINDTTIFYITDQDAFGRFASAMITSQNVTWQLENYDLTVQADKFPTAHGISFDKSVTINGINNFAGNIQLAELYLPIDNPTAGIDFDAVTLLYNPSPFALDLGTAVFDLFYQGIYLGASSTGSNLQMSPGQNNITLRGNLIPQTSPADIVVVTEMFANYFNHQTSLILVTGNSTTQPDGTTVSWLTQGFESLSMTVPFQPATLSI